jgi:hypothetical protein
MQGKKIKWITGFVLLFVVLAIFLAKPVYNMFTNNSSWSNNEHADYRSLFKNESLSNLLFTSTIESNNREPESFYCYNKGYNIFVTKLRTTNILDWRNVIRIEKDAATEDFGYEYIVTHNFDSDLNIMSSRLPVINNIEIGIEDGDATRIDFTPNRQSYYLRFKKLSLTLNQNQDYLIIKPEETNYQAAITFIKNGGWIYILLMTPAREGVKIQPDQLTRLIN